MKAIGNRRYRFGFILTTLLGNETRYRNIHKYAARVEDVECVWAPIRHYYLPGEHDPVRMLPGPLHTRGVVLAQAAPVLRELGRLDAVLVHQFEVLSLLAARSYLRSGPLVVAAQDLPPVLDRATYPLYPEQRDKAGWRARLRLANDVWAARRAGHFLGFSEWSADIMRRCGVPNDHVDGIHVGLDLEDWRMPSMEAPVGEQLRLLFVAGDFPRKGGDMLLSLYKERLAGRCRLDIVTRSDLTDLPPGVSVHRGLGPGDPRLVALFQQADLFVLPTTADVSSWVALEAMATGTAVAISRIGGIPDLMTPETGVMFDPNDPQDFAQAVEALVADPARCRRMGRAGRAHVEAHFDAARNVPAIFGRMKAWVDAERPLSA